MDVDPLCQEAQQDGRLVTTPTIKMFGELDAFQGKWAKTKFVGNRLKQLAFLRQDNVIKEIKINHGERNSLQVIFGYSHLSLSDSFIQLMGSSFERDPSDDAGTVITDFSSRFPMDPNSMSCIRTEADYTLHQLSEMREKNE
jgi:hypothetical protein